ncbi:MULTISPECIES: hypothetical protein [Pseudomonas]|uniref:hypothetical protein n=1 Tax=Pseudomonas TaxID=286 RepID=UPI001F44A560|nr:MULTISPECIES: hypothetical protein [Pseudomonas]|tara:strand:+ start:3173 stop:3706 length:534 start_codon:yes stop_codon:yes gene_type:complete
MDYYNIALIVVFLVVITGIVMGWGENRKIVVFQDYNDLGECFLIPASAVVIYLVFVNLLGGRPEYAMIICGIVSTGLFILCLMNTLKANNFNIPYALLALCTKLPLAVLWVFSLVSLLNPSGNNAAQRRQSRGIALVILTVVTPIVAQLVVNKSGSHFNPKQWIKGRRDVSHIRNNL